MKRFLTGKWTFTILSILFLIVIIYFNYFLDRSQFAFLVVLFASAFSIYLLLIFGPFKNLKNHFQWIVGLAITARLSILFALPNLSDDYFRFLWDGMLTNAGISPFAALPSQLAETITTGNEYAAILFSKMNSPDYFSVYPPIHQAFFSFSNSLFPENIYGGVIVLKVLIFFFELITIGTLYKLIIHLKLSKNIVLLYALNPLVIIEFCGNLHFESILISFLLLTVYLLSQDKWRLAAFSFAGAILAKLHPIMLLPFIVKYLGWKKGLLFSFIAFLVTISLFSPFLVPFNEAPIYLQNIFTSLRLYVETFEFNGGIYYFFRWIGTLIYGYNPIDLVGKLLMALNIVGLTFLLFFQKKDIQGLITNIALAYLIYVLLATTVHPWYILPILPFALMLKSKVPLVWSGIIIVSYFAYSTNDWHENFYLLIVQYTFVFIFLINDIKQANFFHENSE